AYVAEQASPAEILTKLSELHDFDTDGHFVTVLCARIDLTANEMIVANAGHLNPLLRRGTVFSQVEVPVGVPIGIDSAEAYRSIRVALPQSGTLLAFTDGLVERRDQRIDVALGRLQESATRNDGPLGSMLDRILLEFGPEGFDDDAAILGVKWSN
ncbi:MAG: PP2C family protein-serine/threonine phosphatase, partial [Acidimicrobiales bacterium]